jgi:hypothetical protein
MRKGIIALSILLSGCANPPDVGSLEPTDTAAIVAAVQYAKDSRTGLCFAVVASRTAYGRTVASIAVVPDRVCEVAVPAPCGGAR